MIIAPLFKEVFLFEGRDFSERQKRGPYKYFFLLFSSIETAAPDRQVREDIRPAAMENCVGKNDTPVADLTRTELA